MRRPRRPPPAWLAWAALPLLASCAVHHLAANAPGHIAVEQPPANIAERSLEPPGDPGEEAISLGYGALAAGGVRFVDGRDRGGAYAVGPELSLSFGRSAWSHADDALPVVPDRAIGLNLGWSALAHSGRGTGPLYAELQYNHDHAYWLAAGWAWDPGDRDHGPQGVFGVGPFYLRYTHLFGDGGALLFGVAIKGSQSWVRSR